MRRFACLSWIFTGIAVVFSIAVAVFIREYVAALVLAAVLLVMLDSLAAALMFLSINTENPDDPDRPVR